MGQEEDAGSGTDGADVFGETLESVKRELFPDDGDGPGDGEVAPLASGDAPWVGAEEKWLRGIDGPCGQIAGQGGERPLPGGRCVDEEVLLVTEQLPKLPSLVPPPRSDRSVVFEIGLAVALLVVVGGAAGVVWWMNESLVEREREILALRASDKQEVVRLEREIRALIARGGGENEARAEELRRELQARQEAASQAAVEPAAEDAVARDGEREHRRDRDTEGARNTAEATADEGPAPLEDYPADETAGPGAASPDEDDLLGGAFPRPSAVAAADPLPIQGAGEFPLGTTELPAKPSREQVKAAMDAVAPHLARCGPGNGRIVMSVTVIGATGRVVSAESTGEAAGTTLGLCAAKAVKLAKFPRFEQARLQIRYPFDL